MTSTIRYPELDEIHTEFLRALQADPAPLTSSALFWHEAMATNIKVDPPQVRSHGVAFLEYLRVHASVKEVPGQKFTQDKLPNPLCAAVMAKHALSPSMPHMITFRYDRTADGRWAGGYTIETGEQYRALVKGRKELDERMAEALRSYFKPGIDGVKLLYGLRRWEEPGPKLGLDKGPVRDFVDVEGELAKAWADLVSYLSSQGVKHIYHADFMLEKPTSRLREGDNAKIRYSL